MRPFICRFSYPFFNLQLCDVTFECDSVKTADEFAISECKNYQNKSPRLGLSLTGNGKQPAHNPNRIEQVNRLFR